MFDTKAPFMLLLAALGITACDAAPPEPTERLAVVASERNDDLSFYALEAADASECAVVLLDDVGSALVVGPDRVVATCDADGSTCELDLAAADATEQACGQSPDAVVDYARTLAEDGSDFRDWCPPSEGSCGDGDGTYYGCISPACKAGCTRALARCVTSCGGDQACIDACDASECLASCCF
jgi:hypothetical protein